MTTPALFYISIDTMIGQGGHLVTPRTHLTKPRTEAALKPTI